MNADDLKELKELIGFLRDSKIGEFELDRGEEKLRIKFASAAAEGIDPGKLHQLLSAASAHAQAAAPQSALPQLHAVASSAPVAASTEGAGEAARAAEAPSADAEAESATVASPMVGTFYESPSPGSPAFVKPGDHVEVGQVLCIIEAMKLMNEIESDVAGEIVSRLVTNGQPVEYGQALYKVRPR